jgi:hypothetical protein
MTSSNTDRSFYTDRQLKDKLGNELKGNSNPQIAASADGVGSLLDFSGTSYETESARTRIIRSVNNDIELLKSN